MFELAKKLFPICRSITGDGFLQSLKIIDEFMGESSLKIHSVKSGTKVFDWVVPPEWNIKDAYILSPDNKKICDFKENNLHILNYSCPVNLSLSLDELQNYLYSLPNMPDAIPYVTSYYKRRFGFCLTHNQRLKLKKGIYKLFIDSNFNEKGNLHFADSLIKSTTKNKNEILISTYLCHPSMANNELSGPCVSAGLFKWLKSLKKRKYNYRFVFIPETIGSICYLSKNLNHLQRYVKAGFVLSCVGDNLAYSLINTPNSNSLSDKVALHILKDKPNFKQYSFLYRGSDERQYNNPLVNLNVVGICRSKYAEYKEYHTSLDNLDFISVDGLNGSLKAMQEIILSLELNETYKATTICEPNLGKRGLYHTINVKNIPPPIASFLAFCDGKKDIIDIANILDIKAFELKDIIENLLKFKLIKRVKNDN
ncbi:MULTISPECIES: DUF4910 domain-containing protein [unclassified Campylobacter]|uniref:DUF4910 domain-containing protein n=1 Tax=unclassified Campylobacter TaxID=2593542 RepID=UPI001CC214A9|nr:MULTISPECIES: DUF4910 domain-containing protein [unclassified Campylobacter]